MLLDSPQYHTEMVYEGNPSRSCPPSEQPLLPSPAPAHTQARSCAAPLSAAPVRGALLPSSGWHLYLFRQVEKWKKKQQTLKVEKHKLLLI